MAVSPCSSSPTPVPASLHLLVLVARGPLSHHDQVSQHTDEECVLISAADMHRHMDAP